MRDLLTLYGGDVTRMRRYGIAGASLVVVVLWVLILHFAAGTADLGPIFGLVLFIDATMMSFLLVGVAMLFEKQEGAIKSLLVLPVGKHTYLGAKSLAVMSSSLVTLVLLLGYAVGYRGMSIDILGLIGAVLLISFTFSQLGIIFTYRARDFTSLLMMYMGFFVVLALPTLLEFVGAVRAEWFTWLQYINPSKAALTLLLAPAVPVDRTDLWVSLVYLVVVGAVLAWLAWRNFDGYAAREIGG